MRHSLLAFIFILVGPILASAGSAERVCLDKSRTNSLMKDFSFSSGGLVAPSENWYCEPEGLVYKTFQALIALEDHTRLDLTTDEFNKNVFGVSAMAYLKKRVRYFVFEPFCGGALAYVEGKGSQTVHLCPELGKMSVIYLASALLHEVRHMDGPYHHVACNGDGDHEPAACDPSYEWRGSFGVQTEFNIRLSRTENAPKEMRSEARAWAIQHFASSFKKRPFGIAEGFFAQTKDLSLLFISEKSQTLILPQVPNGLFTNRYGRPTWFDIESGQVVSSDIYRRSELGTTLGSVAIGFSKNWSLDQRRKLQDVVYTKGGMACLLLESHIDCSKDGKTLKIETEDLRPQHLMVVKDDVWVGMDGNEIRLIPGDWAKIRGKKLTQLQKLMTSETLTSLVEMYSSKKFAVNTQGQLLKWSESQSLGGIPQEVPAPSLEKIVGPLYWSPKLKDL